jgi:hypothetical protein
MVARWSRFVQVQDCGSPASQLPQSRQNSSMISLRSWKFIHCMLISVVSRETTTRGTPAACRVPLVVSP